MMEKRKINPGRVYYNYEGQFPPSPLESERPAVIPSPSARSHPKRITDTTLRDGSQDPCFALFPHETKLRYYDLLHELDNGTGRIEKTGMLASASDHHIFDKLNHPSKEAAIEKYLVPIMTALENGIRPRVHLEDATKADISG